MMDIIMSAACALSVVVGFLLGLYASKADPSTERCRCAELRKLCEGLKLELAEAKVLLGAAERMLGGKVGGPYR